MYPFHHSTRAGRRLSRGQAVVELALIAPVLLLFVYGIVSVWQYYQQTATYSSASQTLAESIARTGTYDSSMHGQIKGMLDQALYVDSTRVYLTIIVADPSSLATTVLAGSVVPTGQCGPPEKTGWDETFSTGKVPAGDLIQVDVWSCHTLFAPAFGIGVVLVPDGHSVFRSMGSP